MDLNSIGIYDHVMNIKLNAKKVLINKNLLEILNQLLYNILSWID